MVAVSSSAVSSSTGDTVTVCAVFHVAGVNDSALCSPGVTPSASAVATFASLLVAVTVTVPVGWPPSATV